ncbi:hypothetical protein PCL_08963 [Purpureocillium lilacinum]|uniref:Uncharacterized protein n=1 Tax=Purpureocillium lilacinum TaxID=33203 RepID=A0A2U3EGN3_PURLI|nr:hypothetical protein PCL_08963 [Purpureocillium lilacinum]
MHRGYVQLGTVAGRGGGGGGGSFTSRATDYLWEHNHGQGIRAVVIGAVQVGFFCPAQGFGACTSNPEHSTAPRGRDGNPHQTLCVLRPAVPPRPNTASAARLGGHASHSPPRLPGLEMGALPPKAWAGLQVGRTGGLPALGGSRPCRRHWGALPRLRGHAAGASATPDWGTNDDNRSRRWLCSRARFRVAATMGNVASHLSRGGNYASRAGEHARGTA